MGLMDRYVGATKVTYPLCPRHQIAGIDNQFGSPLGTPLLWKNREGATKWYERVSGWKEWEQLYCHHMAPVVPKGREEFSRNFSWLAK